MTEEVKATAVQLLSENEGHVGRTLNQLKRRFQPDAHVKQERRTVTVRRGDDGLGIDVGFEDDELNLIKEVVEGSRAEEEGEVQVGDIIIAVDGERMDGRPLGEVLEPGLASYMFTVLRDKSTELSLVEEREDAAIKMQAAKRGRSSRRAHGMLMQRLEEAGVETDRPGVKALAYQMLAENEGHVGRTLNRLMRALVPEELTVGVRRGEKGLGISVDDQNVVLEVLEGSLAEADGMLRVGDVITAVGGDELGGRQLAEVMKRDMPGYSFTLLRKRFSAERLREAFRNIVY